MARHEDLVIITRGVLSGRRGKILREYPTFASIAVGNFIATLTNDFYTPYPAGGMPLSRARAGAELQAERSEQP